MEVEKKVVTHDYDTDSDTTEMVRRKESVLSEADAADARAYRADQVVWFIVGVIEVVLALRIIFAALGARAVGFVQLIYNLSEPFVAPFRGIFTTPRLSGAYFDTAALLAMLIILLIGWGITALIDLANRPVRRTRVY